MTNSYRFLVVANFLRDARHTRALVGHGQYLPPAQQNDSLLPARRASHMLSSSSSRSYGERRTSRKLEHPQPPLRAMRRLVEPYCVLALLARLVASLCAAMREACLASNVDHRFLV